MTKENQSNQAIYDARTLGVPHSHPAGILLILPKPGQSFTWMVMMETSSRGLLSWG